MSLKKLCHGAGPAIRKVVHEIDDQVAEVSHEVLAVTAKLKALERNSTVEEIISIVPGGSKVEGWINTAFDKIFGIATTAGSVADKIKMLLDGTPTEYSKNMQLSKIASVATAVGDGFRKSESLYDSATQIGIETGKVE